MNIESRAASTASASLGKQTAAAVPVAVLLAGGDTLFREGLKRLFDATALSIVGEVETPSQLSKPASTLQPNIVIAADPAPVQTAMSSWHGTCKRLWPNARMIVLLSRGEDRDVIAALRAGADGCLFAAMSPAALIHAVTLVALGENVFPTRVGHQIFNNPSVQPGQARLTPRERDILRGLLAGQSNKMIANELGTTDMTVKAQLRHLLRKLGVSNRTQAALWAHENGFE